MFVKLKFKQDDVDKEMLYDCRRFSWRGEFEQSGCEYPRAEIIIDVGEQDERTVEFECAPNNEFIVMNNRGKTIDRKVW